MPKNKGKGGKNRRRGKNENDKLKRELIFKEDGQEYAQVSKMMGNGWISALCFDGKSRLCHIRGKMRKKVWVNPTDIVLIGLRDFQDNKADVIYKYAAEEARTLKAYGELPDGAFGDSEATKDDNLISFEHAQLPDEPDGMPDEIYDEKVVVQRFISDTESEDDSDDNIEGENI
ncbi:hypothetical protein A3Q56_06746 [Intoshia linei]|uniref:Eukaryotic translation initiation factor 4C n=1 Tax=Intoshia linei TaxID=1819745 RepID=A0A177AVS7_9BILA|nr:hypothetical protein A3Q56_06746 [Intoshia linei]